MTLTEKQTKQAQDLIEQYGFCSLETQKELAEAGFFEKIKPSHILCVPNELHPNRDLLDFGDGEVFCGLDNTISYKALHKDWFICLPMPQFHEIWTAINKGRHLVMARTGIEFDSAQGYAYAPMIHINICDCIADLWLKLHKEGLL